TFPTLLDEDALGGRSRHGRNVFPPTMLFYPVGRSGASRTGVGQQGARRSPHPKELQVSRSQARVLGDAGQHPRAYFVVFVKGKYVIRPTDSFQDTVRATGLALDAPADPKQGSQCLPGLRSGPLTHGATAKTLFICGTGSPWSSRSAR